MTLLDDPLEGAVNQLESDRPMSDGPAGCTQGPREAPLFARQPLPLALEHGGKPLLGHDQLVPTEPIGDRRELAFHDVAQADREQRVEGGPLTTPRHQLTQDGLLPRRELPWLNRPGPFSSLGPHA